MINTEPNASQGIVESVKDKLVKDLRAVVADAEGLVKEVAISTADDFAAARTKFEGKLVEARSRLGTARMAVTERVKGTADAAHVYVRENPWTALGVAAAAGLVIGYLFSRR